MQLDNNLEVYVCAHPIHYNLSREIIIQYFLFIYLFSKFVINKKYLKNILVAISFLNKFSSKATNNICYHIFYQLSLVFAQEYESLIQACIDINANFFP